MQILSFLIKISKGFLTVSVFASQEILNVLMKLFNIHYIQNDKYIHIFLN